MTSRGVTSRYRYRQSLHLFFFFNDTATTEIYPLSLHDALPISNLVVRVPGRGEAPPLLLQGHADVVTTKGDRKSTRLNSSHSQISYAVFCLKKKKPAPSPTTSPSRRACAVSHRR